MPFEGSRAPRLDEPLDWTNHPFDSKEYVCLGIVAQRGAPRMTLSIQKGYVWVIVQRAEGLNGAERAFICAGTPRLDETTTR